MRFHFSVFLLSSVNCCIAAPKEGEVRVASPDEVSSDSNGASSRELDPKQPSPPPARSKYYYPVAE